MEFNYQNKFWQGLPILITNFDKKHKELTLLSYVFTEYAAIEIDFARGLDRLSSFKMDYDKTSTYGQGIESIFALLKQEADLHVKKSETMVKTLKEFFDKPTSLLRQNFDYTIKDFNVNDNWFFDTLRELENLRIKLHSQVHQVEVEKLNEFSQNLTSSSSSASALKTFPEEQANKITSTIQNAINKATETKELYITNIANANKDREIYIRTANLLFVSLQSHDTDLIKLLHKTLIKITDINMTGYKELSKLYSKCDGITNIDPIKDIEDFIDKNQTQGYEPFELEFIPYSPQSEVLPVDISNMSVQEREKCNECRLEVAHMFKIDDSEQRSDWPQIENLARLSFEGKLDNDDTKTLLTLFNKESNQKCYLNYLNQTRTKGHYIINETAFTSIGELINGILNSISLRKIEDINYGLVQYCIIISQTYGKPAQNFSDEKILVQQEIMKNKIWKNKDLWRNLIKNAISAQLNNKTCHSDYCQGLTTDKQDIRDKSAFSNILTYADTLKSFQFSEDKIMEILLPLCKLHHVDEKIVEEVSKKDESESQAALRSSIKNMFNKTSNIDEMDNENKDNGNSTTITPKNVIETEKEEEDQESQSNQLEDKREIEDCLIKENNANTDKQETAIEKKDEINDQINNEQ